MTAAAVAEFVRATASTDATLRIVGSGRWLDAGRPVAEPQQPLSLAALQGVVDYEPGDLVITVAAGTTLAAIDALTAPHGQWIGLDPFGDDTGTVGATVATASLGPLSAAYGAPRDQLLGLTYVAGDGTVARAGGRVVKNVAGFDVVRLQCGAWGTLGVITELSLRCFARPAEQRTVAFPFPETPTAQDEMIDTLRTAALAPLAMVLVDGPGAARLGLPAVSHLVLRLGGNAASVTAQTATALAIGGAGAMDDLPDDIWSAVRGMDGAAPAVARLSARPAGLAQAWRHVTQVLHEIGIASERVRRTALVDRGVIRLAIEQADHAQLTAAIARLCPPGGAARWDRLPASAWPFVRSAVDDPLAQRVRRAFDPTGRLNRGILGERSA